MKKREVRWLGWELQRQAAWLAEASLRYAGMVGEAEASLETEDGKAAREGEEEGDLSVEEAIGLLNRQINSLRTAILSLS